MAKFNEKTFNPDAFGKYVDRIPKTKRNELIKSRALKGNEQIREAFSSQTGTAYATLPMKGLLEGDALNYDGKTDITSERTTTFERSVVVWGRSKAWTEDDFSTDITGGTDFMDNVAVQVSGWWDDVYQDVLLSVLKGIFAMTGAKNLEFVDNHTYDITAATGEDKDGNSLACVGPTTLNTAIQKASGDNKSKFTIAIMHSTVATNLENLRLLSYMKYTDADGIQRDLAIGTWNGRAVIVDDSMPSENVGESASGAGDGYTKFTTYVLGDGAIDFEKIGAEVANEMSRDPKTNGGETTLYTRDRACYAPYGISYTKKNQKSLSPTNAELADGANWTLVNNGGTGSALKVIDHKAIPIARIISRG